LIKNPGEKRPEPPGGRAAERLRMFNEARGLDSVQDALKKKRSKRGVRASEKETSREKQTRPKK
jgi:hypothetical protein